MLSTGACGCTLLWPFLWSVHTLKDPCISSFPSSLRFPCKHQHTDTQTDIYSTNYNSQSSLHWLPFYVRHAASVLQFCCCNKLCTAEKKIRENLQSTKRNELLWVGSSPLCMSQMSVIADTALWRQTTDRA